MKTCETCRWFDPTKHGNGVYGTCRAHPPAFTATWKQLWPGVTLDDWCGEHEGESDTITLIERMQEDLEYLYTKQAESMALAPKSYGAGYDSGKVDGATAMLAQIKEGTPGE